MPKRDILRILKWAAFGIAGSALLCFLANPAVVIRFVPLLVAQACIAAAVGLLINRTSNSTSFRMIVTTLLSTAIVGAAAGWHSLHVSAPLDPAVALVPIAMAEVMFVELPAALLTAFAVASERKEGNSLRSKELNVTGKSTH